MPGKKVTNANCDDVNLLGNRNWMKECKNRVRLLNPNKGVISYRGNVILLKIHINPLLLELSSSMYKHTLLVKRISKILITLKTRCHPKTN